MNKTNISADEDANAGQSTSILVVSGLSGAGKTTALHALEDIGYEVVDNLPLSLLPYLVKTLHENRRDSEQPAVAIGVDSRTLVFDVEPLHTRLDEMRHLADLNIRLLFVDCSDEILQRRYTTTRRPHPLSHDRPVADVIAMERDALQGLHERANLVIDTTDLTVHDLRRLVSGHFDVAREHDLRIAVMSFSYRKGLPREADLVFDVRFLPNPHYIEDLSDLTGLDKAVGSYIAKHESYTKFFAALSELVLSLLPQYKREGKAYLTIAFGCTGGRHRSVFVAEALAARLRDEGAQLDLIHRELNKVVESLSVAHRKQGKEA